jgi:hypothetical protein
MASILVRGSVHRSERLVRRWAQPLGSLMGRLEGDLEAHGSSRVLARVVIPPEEPADEEPDIQERAHDRRGGDWKRACGPQELIQRDAGAEAANRRPTHHGAARRQERHEPVAAAVRTLASGSVASFMGGTAAAHGNIPIPFAKKRPVAFSASGGMAAFIIAMILGFWLYAK